MAELGFNKTNVRDEKMTVTMEYDFPFDLRFRVYEDSEEQ